MDTPAKLNDEQMAFLVEHDELFEAIFELADSESFKAIFDHMLLSEVFERYEVTYLEGDTQPDATLHERYVRLKSEMETDDQQGILEKLRSPSLFNDLNFE